MGLLRPWTARRVPLCGHFSWRRPSDVRILSFNETLRRGLVMAKQTSDRRILPWLIGVGAILAASCTPASLGQILVDLTIDGPANVLENTETQYCATAHFDDDSEFDVTIFCDWLVEPDTYSSMDTFGRLITLEVSENEPIVVSASFTWDDVALDDSMDVMIFDVPPDDGEDPWPFWGRTPTRIGNTSTVGPQTPAIDWSIQISGYPFKVILEASPVMDSKGRIFIGTIPGITAVDSIAREVLWDFTDGDAPRGVAVWGGRVVWGDVAPFSTLYCYDAATGEEIWTFQAPIGFNHSAPVIDPTGVVYIADAFGNFYARRIEDGSEVWTTTVGGSVENAPSLDWPVLLTSGGGPGGGDLVGLDPLDGESQWTFSRGSDLRGIHALHQDRVYAGSSDRYLYCLDAKTGKQIWRFWCEQVNRGSVAVGHDGTIYTATSGNVGILFAVSPDGRELWRYDLPGLVFNAPIVGGDGTVYLCSQLAPNLGWVHAVRPDGSELWTKQMPHQVTASPMLAPDGTLYVVCRDKYLYAFKDPDVLGDLDGSGSVGAADLLALLASWGKCPDLPETCPADLDLNGNVGAADLLILLSNWG